LDSPSSLLNLYLSPSHYHLYLHHLPPIECHLRISCGAFVPPAVKWPPHTRLVSRITDKALVTSNIIQSVCLVGKGRLKERCGLEPRTNFFFLLRNPQKLVRIRFENIRYIIYTGCPRRNVPDFGRVFLMITENTYIQS